MGRIFFTRRGGSDADYSSLHASSRSQSIVFSNATPYIPVGIVNKFYPTPQALNLTNLEKVLAERKIIFVGTRDGQSFNIGNSRWQASEKVTCASGTLGYVERGHTRMIRGLFMTIVENLYTESFDIAYALVVPQMQVGETILSTTLGIPEGEQNPRYLMPWSRRLRTSFVRSNSDWVSQNTAFMEFWINPLLYDKRFPFTNEKGLVSRALIPYFQKEGVKILIKQPHEMSALVHSSKIPGESIADVNKWREDTVKFTVDALYKLYNPEYAQWA